MRDIRNEVIALMKEKCAYLFHVDIDTLGEDTRLAEDLQCKSVNYVQLSTYLEDEYDVEVPYMAFKRNKTIGDIAEYMMDLLEC